jgi:hypothetical protein
LVILTDSDFPVFTPFGYLLTVRVLYEDHSKNPSYVLTDFHILLTKSYIIPKGQLKMNNPEILATLGKWALSGSIPI